MFVSGGRQQLAVFVLLVVILEFVHSGVCQQFVPVVHLHAERVQYIESILSLLDDGIGFLILLRSSCRKHCQIMLEQSSIRGEFHHLRVYEHEFEL